MTAPQQCFLMVDMRSYWLQGTGRGGGADYDLVADRDSDGLPVLRGRHLRGLLREASRQAHAFGWPDAPDPELFFGGRGENGHPGCVTVDDAMVAQELASEFIDPDSGDIRIDPAVLFRRVSSTAIHPETGSVLPKTLRTIEVATPLPLYSRLSWRPETRLTVCPGDRDRVESAASDWSSRIEAVLSLVDGIGAKRSRGMGQACLSVAGEAV